MNPQILKNPLDAVKCCLLFWSLPGTGGPGGYGMGPLHQKLRWWFSHCYRVWAAPNSYHIQLVVKAPSICHHSKSCEETLRKAMEGMEYSWKLPGGFPMCRHVSFGDDDLPFQNMVVIYRSLWLQIVAEANLKFHFREYFCIFFLSVKCASWTFFEHFLLACYAIWFSCWLGVKEVRTKHLRPDVFFTETTKVFNLL